MITTCCGCQARYRLDDAKVPHRQIQVRCPACQNVFKMDGTRPQEAPAARVEPAAAAPAPTPAPEPVVEESSLLAGLESFDTTPEPTFPPPTEATAPPPPPPPAPAAPAPAARPESEEAAVAVAEPPRPARRRRRDKEEMLARALVSDILVYNRETRDKALAAGNLLEALGPEIKKSWELYKEKVGAENAGNTTHFRDALNEILAEGQKIF